ncbi:MFS transporter [Nocardiopsis alba]|uniref:MFS transporter n=1 Tax=Nocardiopsis alba TaxID=53437 RepID=UPI00367044B1
MSTTSDAPDPSIRLLTPERRPVVLGVFGLMGFIAFESFAVTTALPVVARDLGAERWYAAAFAATLTAGLIGMTVGGSWADRRGPLRPLLFGGTTFLLGVALCVAAPGMGVFVLGRLLQGIGGGIDSVVLYVVIARFVHEDVRHRMFALLTAAWLLPSLAGPLISGALVELVHWRTVFAFVLAGSALSLACLVNVVRRSPSSEAGGAVLGRRELWAAVAAVALLGLHLTGPVGGTVGIAAMAGSAALLLVAAVALLPSGTLRARAGIPRLVALRTLLGASVTVTDVHLPPYLQHVLGYTPTMSGLVVAVGALGWASGAWFQGRSTADPHDPGLLWRAGVLVACGPLGAALVVGGVLPVPAAVVGCVLMGFGMGAAYPRISASVLALSPVERRGEHGSSLQISEAMGSSLLLAATGAILASSLVGGYPIVYSAATVVALGALAVALAARGDGGARRVADGG